MGSSPGCSDSPKREEVSQTTANNRNFPGSLLVWGIRRRKLCACGNWSGESRLRIVTGIDLWRLSLPSRAGIIENGARGRRWIRGQRCVGSGQGASLITPTLYRLARARAPAGFGVARLRVASRGGDRPDPWTIGPDLFRRLLVPVGDLSTVVLCIRVPHPQPSLSHIRKEPPEPHGAKRVLDQARSNE